MIRRVYYLNRLTIATANRARRIITMAPRAMTIHFATLTMVVREESARSIYRCARFKVPDAKIIKSSICPTIGISGMRSTGLIPYSRQRAIITHGPTTEGNFLFAFISFIIVVSFAKVRHNLIGVIVHRDGVHCMTK